MISAINQTTNGNGTAVITFVFHIHWQDNCKYFVVCDRQYVWIVNICCGKLCWKSIWQLRVGSGKISVELFLYLFLGLKYGSCSMSTEALLTVDITMCFWLHCDKIGIAFCLHFLDSDNLLIKSFENRLLSRH